MTMQREYRRVPEIMRAIRNRTHELIVNKTIPAMKTDHTATVSREELDPCFEEQRYLQVERISVSDLFCPFAAAVNVHAAAVQKETAQWTASFGLLPDEWSRRRFYATAATELAARTRPAVPLEELRLTSDLYVWMFLQDDMRDESEVGWHPEHLSDEDAYYLNILSGEDPAERDGPLVHALADLTRRLRAWASGPVWTRRFARAVGEYLDATIWEASNRARGTVPDLATYVEMRPLTGGLGIDDELIGLCEGTRLPREVTEHEVVRFLRRASANAVCWANDLLSLEKELACGDMHNLVLVLAHTENLELRQATQKAVRMHDAEVRTFIESVASLPSFGNAVDANLARYVATLATRMRGNLDWVRESERYRKRATPTESPVELPLETRRDLCEIGSY